MITFRKILGAITYPFRRMFDLIHNGQADIEGAYPENFHPSGEQVATTTSLNTLMH